MPRRLSRSWIIGALFAPAIFGAPADRIATAIDESRLAIVPGHVRTLAPAYRDQGAVPSDRHLELTLHLKPSAAQKADLDQLLIDLQDPASPRYHVWITPEEYADRFAISATDAGKITTWLESHGFHVNWVGRARSLVAFDGAASAAEAAFHAGLRQYSSPAAIHFANSRNPSIPQALADVVQSISGLDDFLPVPAQQAAKPEYTNPNGSHTLSPGDLAVIYDFQLLLNGGIDGTDQTVVIAGQSNVYPTDFQLWATRSHVVTPNVLVTAVPGFKDPGYTSSLAEADLDVMEVAAAARKATISFVYSTNVYTAVTYAIDQNLAPVINASFHVGCDAQESVALMNTYQALAQQGNTQGITWLNSTGDTGAAGCDANGSTVAVSGLATRFPADIPEVTAVGGSEFSELGGAYWAAANANAVSALSYIPEMVWNDSVSVGHLASSTGGASTYFGKPAWQAGDGVPNDGQRDVPDVSFSASAAHDPYEIYTNGALAGYGGTSASSPMLAGMVTLLNQYLVVEGAQSQPGVGNLNAMLYRLAKSNPTAFHDITIGNNIVPCTAGTLNCTSGSMGYSAGPGYDLCTGLGSLDVAKFFAAAAPPLSSAVTVSSSANPVYQQVADANGVSWSVTLTLNNGGAGSTTLTGMTVDGQAAPLSTYFPALGLAAAGSMNSVSIGFADAQIPQTHSFSFSGVDIVGRTWSVQLTLPFVGFQPSAATPAPTIAGSTNGASYQQAYAPGMILSIFGTQLGSGTLPASTLPLPTYMENFEATVNGTLAPLYYVSPSQVNLQIPYGTPSGPATLVVYESGQSASSTLQIVPAAPGIFTDATGNTVPYASGSAGQTLVLFLTGDGEVSPALASGSSPSTSLPVTGLPQSILPVTLTIGGKPATIAFDGIPYGLAGVTQINFVVPAGLAAGPQQVVVTVGTTASKPATFTIVSN
jgi:uncharacterized protein (TIGR03437 family)